MEEEGERNRRKRWTKKEREVKGGGRKRDRRREGRIGKCKERRKEEVVEIEN